MTKIYFRYKEHPCDLLRDDSIVELPNPDIDMEKFLVQFLYYYQNNDRITLLNDLYKWLHKEFSDKKQEKEFASRFREKTIEEIKTEINIIEMNLAKESYCNFYHLLLENKIEVVVQNE